MPNIGKLMKQAQEMQRIVGELTMIEAALGNQKTS